MRSLFCLPGAVACELKQLHLQCSAGNPMTLRGSYSICLVQSGLISGVLSPEVNKGQHER